jgi:hypothetical protein
MRFVGASVPNQTLRAATDDHTGDPDDDLPKRPRPPRAVRAGQLMLRNPAPLPTIRKNDRNALRAKGTGLSA